MRNKSMLPNSSEIQENSFEIFTGPNKRYCRAMDQLMTLVCYLSGGLTIVGEEHIPEKGPFIVASNHISHMDIPAVGRPVYRRTGIAPHYMSKREHFDNYFSGVIVGLGGGFQFDREDPLLKNQPKVVKRLEEIFFNDGKPNEKGVLIIFPEGTRNRRDGRVGGTLGLIAVKYGITVVPVGLAGTSKQNFERMTVVFGEPIVPPEQVNGEFSDPSREFLSAGNNFRKTFQPVMQNLTEQAQAIRDSN